MTQDEIIRMAREAGFTGCLLPEEADNLIDGVFIDDENWIKPLERFAALVAAHEKKFWMEQIEVECNEAVLAEREACANVCDDMGNTEANMNKTWRNGCSDAAAAIRARGE